MRKITFTFLLILAACAGHAQVYISFPVTPPPMPLANAGPDTLVTANSNFNLIGSITGGTTPYTFHWSPGQYLNDSTLLFPTASISVPVTFTLFVRDNMGCEISDQVSITVKPDGIDELIGTNLRIFPNPGQGQFTVEGLPNGKNVHFRLLGVTGELAWQSLQQTDAGKCHIQTDKLPAGLYFLEIRIDDKQITRKLFIR